MTPAVLPAPQPPGRGPRWAVGPGGWDTHAHVFVPRRFPLAPERTYTPPQATATDYLSTLDHLGVRTGVLVQPSAYGTDHRCLLSALAAHPDRLLGVVDLDPRSTSDVTFATMDAAGVRGLRVRWPASGPRRCDDAVAAARELGWHLDVLLGHCADLPGLLARTGEVPVMVEAMASPTPADAVDGAAVTGVLDRLRAGAVWAKLSHPYQFDTGPDFAHARRFARAIVGAAPDRVVWGSDWPHPMRTGPTPADADLLDLVPTWTGGEELARRVLVHNPARFYGAGDTIEREDQ